LVGRCIEADDNTPRLREAPTSNYDARFLGIRSPTRFEIVDVLVDQLLYIVDPSWYDSPCREGVCDRWSLALDPTSRKGAKPRRRVVDLAKDPGCDGAWANGGKLDGGRLS
jgi:hypothetical protein